MRDAFAGTPAHPAGTDAPTEPPLNQTPAPPHEQRPVLPAVAGWLLVGLAVAVLAVAVGGAAPTAPPAGLPDPGPVPGWLLPLLRLAGYAAALTAIGTLLAALLSGSISHRRQLIAAAVAAAALNTGSLLLGLSEIVARPVPEVLTAELLGFYGLEVPQGRALLTSAALWLTLALAALFVRGRAGTVALLLLALAALVPPLLEGHAANLEQHRLAQSALVLHVLASALWVGGLAALTLLRSSSSLAAAAQRFSVIALPCAGALAASGLVSSYLRLDLAQLFTTSYGGLVLAKTAAFALLVAAGALHRRRTLPRLAAGAPHAFRRLAVAEVTVMAAAYGLAVALSRTPIT